MSNTLPLSIERATEVYRESVPRLEVARAYVQAEMPRFVGGDVDPAVVEPLNDADEWRRLEAMSHAFRLNWTFFDVSNEGNDWSEVRLPIEALTMTGTAPHIDAIVNSPNVDRNPVAFAEYLRNYFDAHDESDDPKGLSEFRPRTTLEELSRHALISIERGDEKISMVDGMHRLVTSAVLGATSVRVFAGYPNGERSLSRWGDSTFLSLRLAFEAAENATARNHVLETAVMMAGNAADGQEAIERYWIDEAPLLETKAAGQSVLDRLT